MMQVQTSKQVMTQAQGQPVSSSTVSALALVAVATIAANVLMALGWSHILNGAAWMAAIEVWPRLVWMLGFGLLMASNNGIALLLGWYWAQRQQQQAAMLPLIRWAKQDIQPLSHNLSLFALPAAVLLAPALLLLI